MVDSVEFVRYDRRETPDQLTVRLRVFADGTTVRRAAGYIVVDWAGIREFADECSTTIARHNVDIAEVTKQRIRDGWEVFEEMTCLQTIHVS